MTEKIKLFFDIETVPETQNWEGYEKKKIFSERYCSDRTKTEEETYFERAPLFAEFSKIVCISCGREVEGKFEIKSFHSRTDEKRLLSDFFSFLSGLGDLILHGYNIISYDIPFVFKRTIVNRLRPHEAFVIGNKKPREVEAVDIRNKRAQTGVNCSLEALCLTLGVSSPKGEMSGKKVWEVFYADRPKGDPLTIDSRMDAIVKYCEGDVIATKGCLDRIMEVFAEPVDLVEKVQNSFDKMELVTKIVTWRKENSSITTGTPEKEGEFVRIRYKVEKFEELSDEQLSALYHEMIFEDFAPIFKEFTMPF